MLGQRFTVFGGAPWLAQNACPGHHNLIGYGGGGGSRTPVRKALRAEPYMLSYIRCAAQPVRACRAFARHDQNEQETQPASPMDLARALRTERPGPAHCATPLAGPVSKARGDVRLIN